MAYDVSYRLEFFPSVLCSSPTAEQLECEIAKFSVRTRPTWDPSDAEETRRDRNLLRYSVFQRDDRCDMLLHGRNTDVIGMVLHLLQVRERDACLQADGRPILTQRLGQLRLDVERYWLPGMLGFVGTHRTYELDRVLYDFWENGFFRESGPESRWDQHLLQAVREVFGPQMRSHDPDGGWELRDISGFQANNGKLSAVFHRLAQCRLRLPELERYDLESLRNFLQDAAADVYPRRPVLPAVVIGGAPLIATGPSWTHFFWHQFDGHSCPVQNFSGAILPLQMNRGVVLSDPGPILDGLEALSEDPDRKALEFHYPALKALLHNEYRIPDEALDGLHRFLAKSYRLPRFSSGWEALVEFVDCDPLEWFAGWQMVERDGATTIALTRETLEQLRDWYGAEPKCYFLWNNSD